MVLDLLKESQALLEGHFLLSSGKHSPHYVQCAKLLQYPDRAEKAVAEIAKQVKDLDIDIIVGPAMGGIIVAYELGRQLGKPAIFTERVDGIVQLRRGFEIPQNSRVLICEDVVTTGKSSYEVADMIKGMGSDVVGIASIINRSNEDILYPLYSALRVEAIAYNPEDCPLCKTGSKPIKPGSRV